MREGVKLDYDRRAVRISVLFLAVLIFALVIVLGYRIEDVVEGVARSKPNRVGLLLIALASAIVLMYRRIGWLMLRGPALIFNAEGIWVLTDNKKTLIAQDSIRSIYLRTPKDTFAAQFYGSFIEINFFKSGSDRRKRLILRNYSTTEEKISDVLVEFRKFTKTEREPTL